MHMSLAQKSDKHTTLQKKNQDEYIKIYKDKSREKYKSL